MKLYYAPGACSLADHIALAEAELPYELAKVDLKTKRVEDGQDFTAVNPKGYVPALALDDGGVLTENIAVLSYIADKAGALMPAGGIKRFRALEMLAFISTELHKSFKPFFKLDASQIEKDEAAQTIGKRLQTIADQLSGGDFLLGDALSVADCYLFVMLMWARKNGLPLPAGLDGYFDRLKARPGFAKALSEEGLS
ncbi:glutathione binding-like protein [Sphingomonas sp.]|uniref:glutathione binding-like protein n=1 Tax=Sphingomonas sp. TaxID=28214 RepID=UPI003B00FFEE